MSAQSLASLIERARIFPQQWNAYMTRFAKVLSGGMVNYQKITFSYADLVNGSAVSKGFKLPASAVVLKATVHVTSAITYNGDGGSSISLGAQSAVDLKAATLVSNAFWSATGYKAGIPVNTAATLVPMTSEKQMTATLALGGTDTALTGGSFDLWIEWVDGNAT